ncbi:hypothetical protein Q7P35_004624 [Cladosporium inversicolor]
MSSPWPSSFRPQRSFAADPAHDLAVMWLWLWLWLWLVLWIAFLQPTRKAMRRSRWLESLRRYTVTTIALLRLVIFPRSWPVTPSKHTTSPQRCFLHPHPLSFNLEHDARISDGHLPATPLKCSCKSQALPVPSLRGLLQAPCTPSPPRDLPCVNALPCLAPSCLYAHHCHLSRHYARLADCFADTGTKAFACSRCPLVSSRKDVILRHARKLHGRCTSPNVDPCAKEATGDSTEGDEDCIVVSDNATTNTASQEKDKSGIQTGATPESVVSAPVLEGLASCNMDSIFDQNFDQDFDIMDFDIMDFGYTDFDFISASHPGASGSNMATQTSSHSLSCNFDVLSTSKGAESASMPILPTPISLDPFADGAAGEQSVTVEPVNATDMLTPKDYGPGIAQQLLTSIEYENLKRVFRSYSKEALQFPSQPMAAGFLRAFFVHLEPHCPIVHWPTFSPSSVKPILFFAMMACGAIFRRQKTVSLRLHEVATEIALETHRTSLSSYQTNVDLSLLQASTLMKYFIIFAEVKGQDARTEFLHNFNATSPTQLMREAVKQQQHVPSYNFTDWVESETISRSAAYSFMLDAFQVSSSGVSAVKVTGIDFLLPSDNKLWCTSRENWTSQCQSPASLMSAATALKTSQELSNTLSNFALATLAADILQKVCSFRAICSSDTEYPEARRSLQALAKFLEANPMLCDSWDAEDPLSHCAVSFLSSARYHLDVGKPLEFVASALHAPESLNDHHRVKDVCDSPISYQEQRALQLAADLWRKDCLVGLRYISSLGPYKFSPLSTASMVERGMLLYWYQLRKSQRNDSERTCSDLENTLQECINELSASDIAPELTTKSAPLLTYARILGDTTVWHYPARMACKRASPTWYAGFSQASGRLSRARDIRLHI